VIRARALLGGAGAAAVACLALPAGSGAATFEVTKRGDPAPGECTPADCSLREAVRAANERGGRDRIELPSRRGSYRLAQAGALENNALTGDLDSTGRLTVVHTSDGRAAIDAGGLDRLFEAFAKLKLVRLALRGGSATSGGALRSDFDLIVRGSKLADNHATIFGGAIGIAGGSADLDVVKSKLIRNSADFDGGAIDFTGGQLEIVRSRVLDSETGGRGALYLNADENSWVKRSRFSGNESDDRGGAAFVNGSVLELYRATISRNDSAGGGGGVAIGVGSLSAEETTFHRNRSQGDGGAVLLDAAGPTFASVQIISSTLSENEASGATANGGGAAFLAGDYFRGYVSTFSGNHAADHGGGLFFAAPNGELGSVTVARNTAGTDGAGIFETEPGSVIRNTLLALNRDSDTGERRDCGGDDGDHGFDARGHNLLSHDAGCGFGEPGDVLAPQPRIDDLAANGGRTKTVALRNGSPAIDAATRAFPNRGSDQRGVPRDRRPDIGAFER